MKQIKSVDRNTGETIIHFLPEDQGEALKVLFDPKRSLSSKQRNVLEHYARVEGYDFDDHHYSNSRQVNPE